MRRLLPGFLLFSALSLAAVPVTAQQQSSPDTTTLAIDLNGLAPSQGACRLTFVVRNGLQADIAKSAFELALFNKNGFVERLITLDFKQLPRGKTRVRQFDLAELECSSLARILINDAHECSGPGLTPDACMDNLAATTVTDLEFGS